ncbi:MAG: D-alanine--D-alanine ligase [Thermodesulfobacteriota bacterium]
MDVREIEEKKALFKTKNIGVLMGGLSEERDISLRSGECVANALSEKGYKAIRIDVGRDVAKKLVQEAIDVAYVALHGEYGEDGCIQGLLEIMGIPYTGSGVLASALAMDKAAAKASFALYGISTPEYVELRNCEMSEPNMKLPWIVKPSSQGSTIGVTLVERAEFYPDALKEAYKHGDAVLVERFIEGRELTVAILAGRVFPPVEIIPKGAAIYDFKSKYVKGMTEFKTPAELDGIELLEVESAAAAAYGRTGCEGPARVDVILSKEGIPYVLEVNTVPGMTDVSLFPRAAAADGVEFPSLIEEILLTARLKKKHA